MRIHLKSEKKKASNVMTKLDKNREWPMIWLAKGRNNYPDNIVEFMQPAQTYRYDVRVMDDNQYKIY